MSSIQFAKMHGLGNDIVIINNFKQTINLNGAQISELANRHLGIGFDQLIILEPSTEAAAFCHIYNADGSKAEQCGNGLRCVARYLQEHQLNQTETMLLETSAGLFTVVIIDYEHIQIIMGEPQILEKTISFHLNSQDIAATLISVGNPHAIIKCNDVSTLAINPMSALLAKQPCFRQGVNIGYMQIVNRGHIYLRTHERGVGETLACGSNACAAVVAGVINGWLDENVDVQLQHGILNIAYDHAVIKMTGPATYVFDGILRVN